MMKDRIIGQGSHLKLVEINWIDDEGNKRKWEAVKRMTTGTGIVSVMAITDESEIIFVSQYRPPVGGEVIEFPAGLCDQKGEALEETALRELQEETGYRAKKIEKLFAGPVSAGLSFEFLTVFWATDLEFVGKKDGREERGITVYKIPFKEADEWLRGMEKKGMLVDVKLWARISYIKDILSVAD
ncbi:MAG: NUDIX hydrolase [Candidatus Pacebacteria bacterium]|nr:NUDIX hydrolase [Candidatus Paceibacterota bacterium]